MPGPEHVLVAGVVLSSLGASDWGPLLGYGPAPGAELLPYFLALLAWVGMALAGLLLSPLRALLRRLRRARGSPRAGPGAEQPPAAREGPGAGNPDGA